MVSYFTAKSYIDQIADAFDLSHHVARALALISFVALVYSGRKIPTSKNNRLLGYGGIISLLVVHSLILWRGTELHLFDRSGNAVKCYILTKEAIRYSERPGVDPETGIQCRPITPQLVERLRAYERGLRPKVVSGDKSELFRPSDR